jgi:adenosine deaminase
MANIASLPKIELHCHLDASVRVSTVAELGRELNLDLPSPLRDCLVAPEFCEDLADYIRRIDLALSVMQRPDHLQRTAREFVEDLAADGVIYGEVRFAPQLHTREGLSLQQVLDAVSAGLRSGAAATGVRVGLIVCCLRHESKQTSTGIATFAADNPGKVCALDLAGDEARYDGHAHTEAFQLAREAGLRRTVHAGEAANANSVWQALTALSAERIGHGPRAVEQPTLVDELKSRSIALEMCPRSNVQTRAVSSLDRHPINGLLKQGVKVTVSTDCRTVSNTTVTSEFELLMSQFGWGLNEFWQCQLNAAEAAFVSDELRSELLSRLHTGMNAAAAVTPD